jgi:hypothetical protein
MAESRPHHRRVCVSSGEPLLDAVHFSLFISSTDCAPFLHVRFLTLKASSSSWGSSKEDSMFMTLILATMMPRAAANRAHGMSLSFFQPLP